MAHVPAEIKQRIETVVADGVRKINERYRIQFPIPLIRYDARGTRAGSAHRNVSMSLNPVLLLENVEDFIKHTPLHELAHNAQYVIYPKSLTGQVGVLSSTGRFKRQKRSIHGAEWQEIMHVLGVDPKRTHDYDVSSVKKATNQSTYDYKCAGCGAIIKLTARRHANMVKGQKRYHRECGRVHGQLAFTGAGVITPVATKTELPKTGPTGDSKIAKCWRIYNNYITRPRAYMIEMFINDADCTRAGAATYYATCKRLYDAGVI